MHSVEHYIEGWGSLQLQKVQDWGTKGLKELLNSLELLISLDYYEEE